MILYDLLILAVAHVAEWGPHNLHDLVCSTCFPAGLDLYYCRMQILHNRSQRQVRILDDLGHDQSHLSDLSDLSEVC